MYRETYCFPHNKKKTHSSSRFFFHAGCLCVSTHWTIGVQLKRVLLGDSSKCYQHSDPYIAYLIHTKAGVSFVFFFCSQRERKRKKKSKPPQNPSSSLFGRSQCAFQTSNRNALYCFGSFHKTHTLELSSYSLGLTSKKKTWMMASPMQETLGPLHSRFGGLGERVNTPSHKPQDR